MKTKVSIWLIVSSVLSVISLLVAGFFLVQTLIILFAENPLANSFPADGFVPFIAFFLIMTMPLVYHVYLDIAFLKKHEADATLSDKYSKQTFWSSLSFLSLLIIIDFFLLIAFLAKINLSIFSITSIDEFVLYVSCSVPYLIYFACVLFLKRPLQLNGQKEQE